MLKILGFINDQFTKLLLFIAQLFPWAAPFAVFMSLLTAVDANYNTLINSINGLASRVAAMPASTYIGQANRLIPLGEILGMVAALIGLKAATMAVRFLKSWIPTMN